MIKYSVPNVRLKPRSEYDLIDDMIEKVWVEEFTRFVEESPFTQLTKKKEKKKLTIREIIEGCKSYKNLFVETKVRHPNIRICMTPESDGSNMKITIDARHNGRTEDMYRAINEIKEMIATIC